MAFRTSRDPATIAAGWTAVETERRAALARDPSNVGAAVDLGVIRARVCDPSSLLLSNRHAGVRAAAELAHRKRWSAEENEPEE